MNSHTSFFSKLPSFFEQLEDRVLFDGVPDAAFVLPLSEDPSVQPVQIENLASQDSDAPRQLILVDGGIEDQQELLLSLLRSNNSDAFEIRRIDSQSDGVEQITELLSDAGADRYSGIHILSHGSAGEVQLGSSVLSNENVRDYLDEFAAWSSALTEDADILFYGCELGKTEDGLQLIETVSAVTGADVAASDDLTGAADKGGDWELEATVGSIETAAVAATSYRGILINLNDDNAITAPDTGVTIDVLGNDTDTAGLFPSVFQQPTNGTVSVQGDGSILYTPNAGFTGVDEFVYTTEPAPLLNANNDTFIVPMNASTSIDVLANDTYRGTPVLTVLSGPSNGAAIVNGSNQIVYTPTPDYFGLDQLTYQLTDATGSTTATVDLDVSSNPLATHYIPPRIQGHSEASNPIELVLNTASTTPVNVTISVPGSGIAPINRTITVYDGDETILIDAGFGEITSNAAFGQVENSGILVEADDSVFVTLRQDGGNAQSFLATKGINALGTEFYAGGVTALGAWDNDGDGVAFISVMATEDGTTVTIDRPVDATWLWGDGADVNNDGSITVNLNEGDTYTVRAAGTADDITGAHIVSNKDIAVSSGSMDFRGVSAGENAWDQLVPIESVGSEYVVRVGRSATETVKVVATQDGTEVFLNGVSQTTLNTGQVWENDFTAAENDSTASVTTTHPSYVFQSSGINNNRDENGMSLLSPVGKNGLAVARFKVPVTGGEFFLVVPTSAIGTLEFFDIDPVNDTSTPFTPTFTTTPVPGNPDFSLLTFTLPANQEVLMTAGARVQLALLAATTPGGGFSFIIGFEKAAINAQDDFVFGIVDTPIDILPLNNDTSTSESPLSISSTEQPANGTVVITGADTLQYTPNAGFVGTDSFEYTVMDEDGFASVATINVDIQARPTARVQITIDKDGDLIHPSIDIDDDNDGILDINEGFEIVTPTGGTMSSVWAGRDATQSLNDTSITSLQDSIGTPTVDNQSIFESGDTSGTIEFDLPANSSVSGVALWAPGVSFSGWDGPIREFTVTVNHSGGSWTSGSFLTEKPSGPGSPSNAQTFELGTTFTDVTSVTLNVQNAWVKVSESHADYQSSDSVTVPSSFNFTLGEFRTFNYRDTDGDGVNDHLDLDSDNDGISDLYESGAPSALISADSNADGTISLAEAAAATGGVADNDGDGLMDVFDAATGDIDAVASVGTVPVNTDFDGVADYLDLDSDNDGIADTIEARPTVGYDSHADDGSDNVDSDGDGVLDMFDSSSTFGASHANFVAPVDTNSDGTADFRDTDSDSDGELDSIESNLNGLLVNADSNNDGIDDGLSASYANPDGSISAPISDLLNADTDSSDADYRSVNDKDSDNVPDYLDIDDDNDGIVDVAEGAQQSDFESLVESLPQGNLPSAGQFRNITGSVDVHNGTGMFGVTTLPYSGSNYISFHSTSSGGRFETWSLELDTPVAAGEEVNISYYMRILDNGSRVWDNPGQVHLYGGSSFGDEDTLIGLSPIVNSNADGWVRVDFSFVPTQAMSHLTFFNTGTAGVESYIGLDSLAIRVAADSDQNGESNHCDLDSDNDGISDLFESGASAAVIAADTNSDGTISLAEAAAANGGVADLDGDGLMDIFDLDNNDVSVTASVGTEPVDSDLDGTSDVLDLDSDNDGIADTIEARPTAAYDSHADDGSDNVDADGDGVLDMFDSGVTFGGAHANFIDPVDTDGDGIRDYLDVDSDADGKSDSSESGLPAVSDATYANPDGSTNNPSATMTNEFGDTSEVAYREQSPVEWQITGATSVTEGGAAAQYTVSLSDMMQAGRTATIDLGISNVDTTSDDYANFVTAVNAAISGRSDLAFDGTTLTYTSDGNPMADLVISLGAVDDVLIEVDEDYTVAIANPGSTTGHAVTVGASTSVTTTVVDNDQATWSLTGSSTVNEGSAAQYTVSLAGTLQANETATIDLVLSDVDTTSADYANFVTAINAAVSGRSDLAFAGSTLIFTGDGNPMADLVISLGTNTDPLVEGDEDFTVAITTPGSTTGADIVLGVANSVTTTIVDQTPPPVVSIGSGSAAEASPIEFTVSLDVPSYEDIVLDLAVASGSATSGSDFETTNFEYFDGTVWQPATLGTQITIPADDTSLLVRVDSTSDGIVEVDETFTLSASVVSGGVSSVSDTGTGTIIDDDQPAISIDDVEVDEDNGTMTFTISLDQAPVSGVSVNWATATGSATSGVDFTAASGTASFIVGQQTQTVTVSITDDNLYEGPETLELNLSGASGATIADAQGIGTIRDDGAGPNGTDDDRPMISIDDVSATEDVDSHAVFTISLSNPSLENTVVSLALSDVSATNPDDYGPGLEFFDGSAWQAVSGNVTIPANATSLQVRTPIIDDPYADSGETYSLIVTHVSGAVSNSGDTGTGTILDDPVPDPTEVSISGDEFVSEGDVANYTVSIDNAPLTDVTITFTYSGVSVGGSDYTGVASVTIPAGSTSAMFSIPTIDDTIGEQLESFTIAIDTLTGGSLEAINVSSSNFEVTTEILDDDIPAIMVTDVLVSEGADPFAIFTVELSNPTFEDIDFTISATGDTASGATVDFGFVGVNQLEFFDGTNWIPATSATIAAGDTSILLRTPINDDPIAEPIETFTVTATTISGSTSNPFDTGTGTIQDDSSDPETILVSLAGPGSVDEGTSTTNYTISLSDSTPALVNAAEDVTVTLVYSGTAIDGSDFTGVVTVVVPAGSSTGTFTLPAVDDSLYEGDESIIVTIDSVAGGGFEGIGIDTSADEVTTVINDATDIPTVSVNDVTVIEGTDNFAVFTVELSNLSIEDVDLSFALSDGTAAGGGTDYGSVGAGNLQVFDGANWVDATTATIPAGEFTVQVRTPIGDDLIDELNETYQLIATVTSGTTTNSPASGTGTILDDDPSPDVTIDDATATEGDPLVFNVMLSNPSSQPLVLDFAANDATATGASDFGATALEYSTNGGTTWLPATNGTEVTIPANFTGVLVRVPTTEDFGLESTETMVLSIDSVVSGMAGNIADTAIGTINDDDSALVSISATDAASSEPADNGQFTVSLSNPSDSPTVVAYSVAGSATGGADYTALTGTVTIPAGANSATIDVSVIDDAVVEGNENVVVTLTSITSGDPQISIDVANDSDTVALADDDALEWSLTGATSVNEGALATYQLSQNLTLQSGEDATVEISIANVSTASDDYGLLDAAVTAAVGAYSGPGSVAWDGTTLTFTSDGTGAMDVLVIDLMAVNDTVVEGAEDYTVSIANPGSSAGSAVAIDAVNNSVTTQIQDTVDAAGSGQDKATWSIVGATSVNESQTTDYTVTIDATLQSGETASVDMVLNNVDIVAADVSDFNTAVANAVTAYNGSGQPGSVAWDGTTLTFTSDGSGPMGDLVVQVVANADSFLEGPEDYSIQLSNAASATGSCVVIDAADTVTTTIGPNATSAEWSIGVDNSGDEGGTVQYSVSLTESFGAGDSASVDLIQADVDTNSSDYTDFVAAVNDAVAAYAGPGGLAFDGTVLTYTATADGDTMSGLTISLGLTNDVIVEGVESFTIGLSNPTGPTGVNVSVAATDDSVTTTINDTMGVGGAVDAGTWSIAGPATGDEGTNVQYTVSLAGVFGTGETASVVLELTDVDTSSGDYALFLAAVDAAATSAANVSFDSLTGTLTYTAPSDGAAMPDFVITLGLATDAISEGDEDFEIELSGGASSTGSEVNIDGAADIVTTTIVDQSDALEWSIAGDLSAEEGGSAQYTISLAGALGVNETATVEVSLTDVTTSAADHGTLSAAIVAAIASRTDVAFNPASGVLTFTAESEAASMAPVVFDLSISNDSLVEGPEQYLIDLANAGSTTGANSSVSTTDFEVTTEIDDVLGVGLGPDIAEWSITGDTSVAEGGNVQYTVSLSGAFGAGDSAEIDLVLSDVDTGSTDYADFVAAVNVSVAAYAGPGALSFDGTTLSFTAASDGESLTDLVIDLGAVDDTLVEGDENYQVGLTNPASPSGAAVALGGPTFVNTTIMDDDQAAWSIAGDVAVGEGSAAQYTLSLADTLQLGETAAIDIGIADVDTSSVDYADFVAAVNSAIGSRSDLSFDGTTLTFTSDGNPMADLVIDLATVNDVLIEGDEDYTVSISNPDSTTGSDVVVGGVAAVTTTITDNDSGDWRITGDGTVVEGVTAQYTIELAGTLQSGDTATVELRLSDTDTNSSDYADFVAAVNDAIAGRSDLSFDGTILTYTGDGSPMASLTIDLGAVDDVLAEGVEDYDVAIANAGSSSGSVGITAPPTVTTTIIDNDDIEWSISGAAAVDEGGTAQYAISLDGVLQSGELATVQLDLTDIETTSADYANFVSAVSLAVSTRSDLSFNETSGVLTATGTGTAMVDLIIDLGAVDDAFIEGPERYRIALSNSGSPTGTANRIDVANSLVTTTISDTDGDGGATEEAVWTLALDQTVAEGNSGAYTLDVSGSLQSGEIVSVDLMLSDIDTIGSDYASFNAAMNAVVTAYSGPGSVAWDGTSLTFTSDGTGTMAPLSISLGTIDDGFAEGPEDFLIRLSNANSSTGIATSIDVVADDAVTTIDDTVGAGADDVTFAIVGDTVVDEGGSVSYTISTTGGLGAGRDATVELSVRNVDTNSADYTNFDAAVSAAVAVYNGGANPGSVSWDGLTLTFTADVDGDELGGLVIDLDAVDDAFLEGPEVYEVDLDNPGSAAGVAVGVDAVQSIVATTINDTDGDGGPAESGGEWSLTGGGVVNEGVPANFTIGLSGNLQAGEATSVEISLGDIDTDSGDYAPLSSAISTAVATYNSSPANNGVLSWDGIALTFTSDGSGPMTDLQVSLSAIDDTLVESVERFDVLLSNPLSSTGLSPSISATQNLATTTILDNDDATWSISGDSVVAENATASYTVSLMGTPQVGETVSIDLDLSDVDTNSTDYADFVAAINNAVSGRSDLTFDGTTLTFTGDGNPMADLVIDLATVNDSFSEGPEDFTVSISNPGSNSGSTVVTGGATSVTTTITDDDTVLWSIAGDVTVDEASVAQYTIDLFGTLQVGETATVDLGLADVDTNSADYTNFVVAVNTAIGSRSDLSFDGTTLTFTSSGSSMGSLVLDVPATDDNLIESSEDYRVSISNAGSTTGGVVGIGGSSSVTTRIVDNDNAAWSLSGDATVTEGGTASYTLSLGGLLQLGETATIDLALSDLTTNAVDHADFVTAVNAAIAARPDLSFDGMTLSYSGDGISPMADLIIELDAIDDSLVENSEDWQISISNPGSTTGGDIQTGVSTSVTTLVTDNDQATWNITGDASVAEGATAQYTVTLSGTLQSGQTAVIDLGLGDVDTNSADYVNFVAAVNAAIAGRPELAFDGMALTYTGDGIPMASVVIDLAAVDDALVEGAEDYNIELSNPRSTNGSTIALGTADRVTTTISDDETAAWSLTGDTMVAEGAAANYTLALSGALQSGETATIDLAFTDIETNTSDYDSFVTAVNAAIAGRSELAFDGTTLTYTGDGSPMADVNIALSTVDDALVEPTEDYSISATNASSTTGSTIGGSGVVTTSIDDNDELLWSITGPGAVDEGGTAQFKLSLDGVIQSGNQASVVLSIQDFDTDSADYANFVTAVQTAVAAQANLTFDPGTGLLTVTGTGTAMPDLCIDVAVVDDSLIEGPERFQVQLSSAQSVDNLAGGVDPTQNSATITINDTLGDGGPAAQAVWNLAVDQVVAEGDPAAYVLSLSGVLQNGETASVDLSLTDLSTASSDYASFNAAVTNAVAGYSGPGSLVWDGTTLTMTSDGTGAMDPLNISLGTNNDAIAEGVESFLISLGNANSTTGAAIAIDAVADDALTTIDDQVGAGTDDVTWSVTGTSSVDEGGVASYLVLFTGALGSGEDASVELGVGDLDTSSVDYSSFSAAVNQAVNDYNAGSNPGSLAWDGTTLTFTASVDGDTFVGISIDLTAIDDSALEGPERYQVSLSNSGSTTGVTAGISPAGTAAVTTINDTQGDGGPVESGAEWSVTGSSNVDEGDAANYTVALTGDLQNGESTSVELSVANIDTLSGDYSSFGAAVVQAVADYNAAPTSTGSLNWDGSILTFTSDGSGPMSGLNISLTTVDDSVVEGDERLNVLIANASSTTGLSPSVSPTQGVVTTTIIDNDTITWSIGGDSTVNEGDTAQYTVTLAGVLQSGETSTIDLTLANIDTTSADYGTFVDAVNTAIAGRPELAFDGTTLTYTADGSPMADLVIDLLTTDDMGVESPESYEVAVSNPGSTTGSSAELGTVSSVTTAILDDDVATWSITGDSAITEGDTAQFVVSLNGTLQTGETSTIDIGLGDVDTNSADYASFISAVQAAIAGRTDLSFDGTTLTYTGDGSAMDPITIDLTTVDDSLVEGDEDFTISVSNPGSTTGVTSALGGSTAVTTTIGDSDSATWSISGDATVDEGMVAQYNLALSGVLQAGETATIDLDLTDVETSSSDYANFVAAVNAAVAGRSDVSFDGVTLTYTGDGNAMSDLIINLATVDDTLVERTESSIVTISNPGSTTGSDVLVDGTSAVSTGILDNDVATWSLTGDADIVEGDTATYTLSLDGTLQPGESVSVQIDLTDVDTDSSDFGDFVAAINDAVALNPDVTFDPVTGTITYTASTSGGMPPLMIDLPIINDGAAEPPEEFSIGLSVPVNGSGVTTTINPSTSGVSTTINGSPVVVPDDVFTNIGTPVTGNVLSNDSDPDGDAIVVTEVDGQPIGSSISTTNGTVVMNPDGSYFYVPNPGFYGVDSFTYTVVDAVGNEETATVQMEVLQATIGVAKAASDPVANGDNWDVTFRLVVENLGNATLNQLSLLDDVGSIFGDSFVATNAPVVENWTGGGVAPTVNANWINDTSQNMLAGGSLSDGESFDVVFTVTIDPDAGGVQQGMSNQARAAGQGVNPDGTPMTDGGSVPIVVTDISDEGTDPAGENETDNGDGIPDNDATRILIADLGIAKSTVGEPELLFSGNYVVTYQVAVENTGTVTLVDLSLLEDLATQFGSAFVQASDLSLTTGTGSSSSNIAIDSNFDGSAYIELLSGSQSNTLAPGDSFSIQFRVEIDPLAVSGTVGNQISGSGSAIDENGDPLRDSNGFPVIGTDLSDSGTDPRSSNPDAPDDTGSSSDVTGFDAPALPLGEISGTVFIDENDNGYLETGERGIEGVEITLQGTDVYGDPVNRVVFTNEVGRYSFVDLNAGTYRITETQPTQFSDGTDIGDVQWTVGNDEFSGIVLNWGQSFTSSTFGERASGTAGFPPTFPTFPPPLASNPIGSLTNGYPRSSSPIYSGVAVGSNAQPLALVSGRPVAGGYMIDVEESGEVPVEFDLCQPCEVVPAEAMPIEEATVEALPTDGDCGCDGEVVPVEVSSDDCSQVCEEVVEESDACEEIVCDDGCEPVSDCEVPRPKLLGSFLKRMGNWLGR